MEGNKKKQKIIKAFKVAIEGIFYTFKFRTIMKIHYFIAIAMIVGSFVFDLSKVENLLFIFSICLMVASEMVNTAVEKTIAMITDEHNELAKIARDVALGGVIISILNGLITMCVIFYDKLIR